MKRLPIAVMLTAGLLPAQVPDATIRRMLTEVSPDRIAATVKALAGFETRNNNSDPSQKNRGIGAARRWVLDQFHGLGPRLEVATDSTRQGAAEIVNIVAVLRGAAEPDKRILVTAHYDSINKKATGPRAAEAPAPGADDDASGIAVVLELARVMSHYRFAKTIVFIAFGGEELGLVGSTYYAVHAKAANEQIEALFNNDIVGANFTGSRHADLDGVDNDIFGTPGEETETANTLRVFSPDPETSPSRRLARSIRDTAQHYVPNVKIEVVSRADRFGRAGDQRPFQDNGFTAVRFTSASENTDTQHTADDTPEGVSPAFTADVARVNGAAIASLAQPAR